MPALVLDGRAIAADLHEGLAAEAAALRAGGTVPCLAVVLVGDDPASAVYVRSKLKTAERLGIDSRDYILPESTPQGELIALLHRLNADPAVHGILVQLPIPKHLDARAVLLAVDPRKDVDGLHPFNLGSLAAWGSPMPACTPSGILELLRRGGVALEGREAVVVGRSAMVGKPTALLLLAANATVTICHSRTRDLAAVCRRADVIVAAVGSPRLIGPDHVKPGAAVIDVGTNRVDGRLVGDVDFDAVREIAGVLTPVPGGVGPLTITFLMKNTLTAARLQAAGD